MMREYGMVKTNFWIEAPTKDLSHHAMLLAIYLLSSPHTTMLGCFRIPYGYIQSDLRFSAEMVLKGFEELKATGFILFDKQHDWLFIPSFFEGQGIANPNQGKCAERLFNQVPATVSFYSHLIRLLLQQEKHLQTGFKTFLLTLLERFRNPDPDPDPKPDPNPKPEPKEKDAPSPLKVIHREPPNADTVLLIPLADDNHFAITREHLADWQKKYPAIDVLPHLRRLLQWQQEQLKRRQTQTTLLPHIGMWLAQAQKKVQAAKLLPKTPPSSQEPELNQVFAHWKQTLNHPDAMLDARRKQLIREALRMGYTTAQLCQAITGCSLTPHNMGQNAQGERYDGLHLILRDGNQIDRFIHNAHHPPRQISRAEQQTKANIETLQQWLAHTENEEKSR